jgi:hypothetical protein
MIAWKIDAEMHKIFDHEIESIGIGNKFRVFYFTYSESSIIRIMCQIIIDKLSRTHETLQSLMGP